MKERITTTIKKGSIYNLKIEKATEDDAGNYSCIVYRDDIEIKRASLVAASKIFYTFQTNIYHLKILTYSNIKSKNNT